MTELGRSWNSGDYRFGYTGHEKENDLAEGVYTTEYRLLDTRLGMVEIESKFFVDLRNYIKNNKKEGTMVPSLEVQVKYEKPNDPNSSTYGGTDKSN
ncbi:MAG: hypothetical protein J5767_06090 [Paludibacteraceae bacterium]|nr:hypothetical protein [Paludibacteraceae bacterium]